MNHSTHQQSPTNMTSSLTLDKVDTWNVYKTCLLARLAEESAPSSLLRWPIKGENVQLNCEESFKLEDLFPQEVVVLVNYLQKLPFSGENSRAVKIFEEFCEFLEREPALLKEEEATILTEVNSSFRGNSWSQSTFTVFSLFLLSLPALRRFRLTVVLLLLDKLFTDDSDGEYLDQVFERVAGLVVKGKQSVSLLHLLLADTETNFGVDKKLMEMVENAKEELATQRKEEKFPLNPRPYFPLKEKKNSNEDLLAVLDFLKEFKEERSEEKSEKKKKISFLSRIIQKL